MGAGSAIVLLPSGCGPKSGFLTAGERRGLAALADAILPPDDTPGGAALGAVEYIEGLLTAFDRAVPAVFRGGPYSGRQPFAAADGTPSKNFPANGFLQLLPLDRVAARAWHLKLYGSTGTAGGGPNDAVLGPIVGLRDQVRQGLAAAEKMAGKPLEQLDAAALASLAGNLDSDFRDTLISLVAEGAFGAPEYGGNPGGAGWTLTHYEGDSQPLGYSLFDTTANVYRERADAPISTANPGADPEPLDDGTRAYLTQVVTALGGKTFP